MTATARTPRGTLRSPRPPGRPTRLNRTLIDAIAKQVRATGIRPVRAAIALGISKDTFYPWHQDGQSVNGKPINRELFLACEQALAEWEIGRVEKVQIQEDPASPRWQLESRFPDEYGKSKRLAVSGEVVHRPFIDLDKLELQEQVELQRLMRKATPDPDQLPPGGAPAHELLVASIDGVVLREEDV